MRKPTRLEREMHKRMLQEQAKAWMDERGYVPAMCSRCGEVPPADHTSGMCTVCFIESQREEPKP